MGRDGVSYKRASRGRSPNWHGTLAFQMHSWWPMTGGWY